MTGTMTSAGLDVHARSIDAAAVCVATGEVTRRRFGAAPEPVIGWLQALPRPVHACYEAGPTGFGLQRAAAAAGIRVDVVAPSKTPRAAGDRVKTDRKDAELSARLLVGPLSSPEGQRLVVDAGADPTQSLERLGCLFQGERLLEALARPCPGTPRRTTQPSSRASVWLRP